MTGKPGRIVAIDLIRGIAVLGILAVNIAAFSGPASATLGPQPAGAVDWANNAAFAITFVLFEGKMRALFSILFGASLGLFIDKRDSAGQFGDLLQLRRLGWLMIFGLLHYYLLWWGDILFLYGLAGVALLLLREMPVKPMLATAVIIFGGWHAIGAAMDWPQVRAEKAVLTGNGNPDQLEYHNEFETALIEEDEEELSAYRGSFMQQVRFKLSERTFSPFIVAISSLGETLPLMMIGLVLFRTDFFSGAWNRKKLRKIAIGCTLTGLGLTLFLLWWLWSVYFPPIAMLSALLYWTALPHLLMAVGYAALLVLGTPAIGATAIGRWLIAAGRMAFSNYIATSIVMTAIFYGWGLGLIGTVTPVQQWLFVGLGWMLMLGWSKLWLSRFGRGPLETVWSVLIGGSTFHAKT